MAKTIIRESLYGKNNKEDIIQPPDLLEIQKKSFVQFIQKGIKEELKNISPILAYGGKYEMEFLDDYKINKKVQSKKRVTKSRKLREDGEKMLQELALTEEDIENIFDMLEEDLPEL